MKRAKIVCTIGPASQDERTLRAMIRSGMDVARLNFSHGTHETHRATLVNIRKSAAAMSRPVAVIQDLQGIKIRIGGVENGTIHLRTGSQIAIREGGGLSTGACLFLQHRGLLAGMRKGDRVLLDDGLIQLRVTGRDRAGVRARVVEGGKVTDRKGVNLPDTPIRVSSFTAKDRKDLDYGIEMGVDYVAVSFVRTASDITRVRRYMKTRGAGIPLVAKIEKPEALRNIDAIIHAADGIMVARGDLGVEMNPEQVPLIQKELIRKANDAGKIVITATQMLESMTEHLRPTRAEANDVANAVIDGTDALMLSAETSTGNHPVEAVRMMGRIIESTERSPQFRKLLSGETAGTMDYPYAAAHAAVRASNDISATAIVAFTNSGYTARLVSKFRPAVPVIAFTVSDQVERRLSLLWGVTPLFIRPLKHTDEMILEVEHQLVRSRYARKGDSIVIIASSPLSISGKTNFVKLHKIV